MNKFDISDVYLKAFKRYISPTRFEKLSEKYEGYVYLDGRGQVGKINEIKRVIRQFEPQKLYSGYVSSSVKGFHNYILFFS